MKHKEEERIKAERETNCLKSEKLAKDEEKLLMKEKNTKKQISSCEKLLAEGQTKLSDALKKSDVQAARVAQVMIEASTSKASQFRSNLEEIRKD